MERIFFPGELVGLGLMVKATAYNILAVGLL